MRWSAYVSHRRLRSRKKSGAVESLVPSYLSGKLSTSSRCVMVLDQLSLKIRRGWSHAKEREIRQSEGDEEMCMTFREDVDRSYRVKLIHRSHFAKGHSCLIHSNCISEEYSQWKFFLVFSLARTILQLMCSYEERTFSFSNSLTVSRFCVRVCVNRKFNLTRNHCSTCFTKYIFLSLVSSLVVLLCVRNPQLMVHWMTACEVSSVNLIGTQYNRIFNGTCRSSLQSRSSIHGDSFRSV